MLSEQTSHCSAWWHPCKQNFQGTHQHKMNMTACKMPTTVLLHSKCSVKCSDCTSNQKQDAQIECWVNKPLIAVLDGILASRISRERADAKWIWQRAKCQQQSCCTQNVASNVPLVPVVNSKTSWLNVEWANLSLQCLVALMRTRPCPHKTDTTACNLPETVLLHPKFCIKCTACTSNQKQDK